MFSVLSAEQDPAAPDAVLGASYREANDDTLSLKPYGGEIVDD